MVFCIALFSRGMCTDSWSDLFDAVTLTLVAIQTCIIYMVFIITICAVYIFVNHFRQ